MQRISWFWLVALAIAAAGALAWSCAGSGDDDSDDEDDDIDDDTGDDDSVTSPPDAPSDLEAEAVGHNSIALSWKDNSDNEDGFYVDRSTDGHVWEVVATLGANTTEYTDAGLYCHYFYYHRVRAFNTAGPSLPSNMTFTPTGLCPFQPPADVRATAQGPFSVKLTWVEQSDEEYGYIVERSMDQLNWAEIGTAPRNATGYDDNAAPCATSLYYRVAAFKPGEISDYSNIASATTDTCPPCADGLAECNHSYVGTTVGQTNELDNYSCVSWNESGPEFIYELTISQTTTLSVEISTAGCDLDIFLLTNCDDSNTCITYGNYDFETAVTPGKYYIVIDGYYGAACGYTLTVGCS